MGGGGVKSEKLLRTLAWTSNICLRSLKKKNQRSNLTLPNMPRCIAFSIWLFMVFHCFVQSDSNQSYLDQCWFSSCCLRQGKQNTMPTSLLAVSHDFLANQPHEKVRVYCLPLSCTSVWSGPSSFTPNFSSRVLLSALFSAT